MPRPGYDIYAPTMMVTMTLAGGGPARVGQLAVAAQLALKLEQQQQQLSVLPRPSLGPPNSQNNQKVPPFWSNI